MIHRLEEKFPDSYRNGNVLMIHGDCMDVMAEIGEKEIPLAIVDPPYGIGFDKQNLSASLGIRKDGTRRKDKSWAGRDFAQEKYKRGEWDKSVPPPEYFSELFRVSKNQIIWGGNYFVLPPSGGWVIWDKKKPNDVSFSEGEMAWVSCSGSVRFFRWLWAGYAQEQPEQRNHPTQKPVALYKWLLSRYAKPGDLILDTHGGSGSIVIACHDLGHPIIWVEKDADYYRDAVSRYKTHASQAVLFEPVEIMKEQKLFEEEKQ